MGLARFVSVALLYSGLALTPLCIDAQSTIPPTQLAGTYQMESGMTLQFTWRRQELLLITAGNPLQKMNSMGNNDYRSATMQSDLFHFEKTQRDSIRLSVTTAQGTLNGIKISDSTTDYTEAMDSLLTHRKKSAHFEYWFSNTDTTSVDSLVPYLENNYTRIIKLFKLPGLPVTRVKIYPDLNSFHYSINQPDAPPQVLATAFGKDEFRMVSPTKGGEELMQFISHEFTHCVHLNIDYSPNNPRWLWEGVAMYASGWFIDPKDVDEIKNKRYPSLRTLGNGMEYTLGYVIIEAIKDLWNFDAVLQLIKTQGNIQKVLHLSDAAFEQKVFDRIYKKYVVK